MVSKGERVDFPGAQTPSAGQRGRRLAKGFRLEVLSHLDDPVVARLRARLRRRVRGYVISVAIASGFLAALTAWALVSQEAAPSVVESRLVALVEFVLMLALAVWSAIYLR